MILNDIAYYVDESIISDDIERYQYVTTDSLLQNKEGRTIATNLPPQTCSLTHFMPGDVLIANIRPYLKKIWKADIEGGCSKDVLVIRAKDGHFAEFVYALAMQDAFFENAMLGNKGTQMPRGDKNKIMEFPVYIYNGDDEQKIGDIIDKIQKKIALNTRMNAELEAMAKQLYDYWFVQFDFPDENGKPYKSSGGKMVYNPTLKRKIPAGWEACTLGDFCDLYQPKTIGTDEMSKNGKYHVYGANGLIGFYDKYNHEKSEIVMACRGNSCGAINRTMPFSWITGNAMVLSVKDKSISNEFISQCTNYMNIKGAITGSGQPQLTRENLAPLLMIYPLQNILKQFSKKVTPIIEHRLHIQKTNEYLTHLRDSLLPMLMNGQVTVE